MTWHFSLCVFSLQSKAFRILFGVSCLTSNLNISCRSTTAAQMRDIAAAKSLQSCRTVCDPIDGSPPRSPVFGILQASTREWVCPFLLQCMKEKSEIEIAQSCLTPRDSMACSLLGSSVLGIFQARVLERGAIAISEWEVLATSFLLPHS